MRVRALQPVSVEVYAGCRQAASFRVKIDGKNPDDCGRRGQGIPSMTHGWRLPSITYVQGAPSRMSASAWLTTRDGDGEALQTGSLVCMGDAASVSARTSGDESDTNFMSMLWRWGMVVPR